MAFTGVSEIPTFSPPSPSEHSSDVSPYSHRTTTIKAVVVFMVIIIVMIVLLIGGWYCHEVLEKRRTAAEARTVRPEKRNFRRINNPESNVSRQTDREQRHRQYWNYWAAVGTYHARNPDRPIAARSPSYTSSAPPPYSSIPLRGLFSRRDRPHRDDKQQRGFTYISTQTEDPTSGLSAVSAASDRECSPVEPSDLDKRYIGGDRSEPF